MQVRRVWSRAARSLLAQRTRAVPVKIKADGRVWRWRWALGTEPNDTAVLEARQYLAADLDVEAIYLDTAYYYSSAQGRRSGLWEPDEQAYDPHRLAKQRLVTTPSLGVEVKLAVSATWMDRAHRGRRLAVRLGNKTRATAEPLARRGYRVVRDRVTREQAVKHLRRAPAPAPDLSGTHTVQASLTFTPEQNARWEGIREQLVRAGVLVGEFDDVPGAKVDDATETKSTGYVTGYVAGADVGPEWLSDLRFPLVRRQPTPDPRRCIDPDNTVHLVHPFLALPLCGKPLKHEERGKNGGARVFYTAGAEGMADDSRMCDVCARMSAALSEPPVDPEPWRSAPPGEWAENNRLFAEALGDRAFRAFKDAAATPGHPSGVHVAADGEIEPVFSDSTASCPGCGRVYGADGVSCHRTPADGWVCEIAIKDHPPTQAGVSKITVPSPSVVQQHLIDTVKRNGGRARLSDLGALRERFTSGQVSLALNYLLDEGLLLTGDGGYVLLPTSPTPVEEASADTPPDLDDGDEMPILLVTFDARVYLPKLMVEAGMVTSQRNGAALVAAGQVTIDGKPCVGKLTFNPIELVGFVVELGGPNTTGSLPRIYESMTRRFRVLMA